MAESRFVVGGGRALQGMVRLSGAKNAALPALALTLLAEKPVRLGSSNESATISPSDTSTAERR